METIVNKVAESGLVTIRLEEMLVSEELIAVFDLKPFLFMEMILREKDFREALKQHDWEQYRDKYVGITCSADAIVPLWAYMLVTVNLSGIAKAVLEGDRAAIEEQLLLQRIQELDTEAYHEQRIVIKGCGTQPIPPSAYVAISRKLSPVVKSLMFGEPCSTVPVYKKKAG